MRIQSALLATAALAGAASPQVAAAERGRHGHRPSHSYETAPYIAAVDVRPGSENNCAEGCTLKGKVFFDINRDGEMQPFEPGIPGVAVSNGLDVVRTNRRGEYAVTVYDRAGGTDVFLTKPDGWAVPTDADLVPQFSYTYMPQGSPTLRFGGIAPTGPLPSAVNFPMVKVRSKKRFRIVVSGDTQPYSNNEVGYVRDTLAREIAEMDVKPEFVIVEGDVMGDDLGLFPRFKNIMSVSETPLYLVPGNHDLDFDAPTDANSYDTFRREFGPAYYSFDIGKVHFVVLDDVRYPCTPEVDNADGLHSFCDNPESSPGYNGRINAEQMEWLKNDLTLVPEDRLVVLNMHIPIVTFTDQYSTRHQVDNAAELYDLVEGRKVLAFSGHTHTLEQFRPGDLFEGWEQAMETPASAVPFHQIVAGAACGSWWSGDFSDEGVPESYQRLGAPRGYLILDFDGANYNDQFKATGKAFDDQMSLSILSPTFRAWYQQLLDWVTTPSAQRSAITPVSINDLPDPSIITPSDVAGDTYIAANIWNSSTESQVWLSIDGGSEYAMELSQPAIGEGEVESLDPFALERQAYVLRYAIKSESGDARSQGFELFGGSRNEGEPQPLPESRLTDRSTHMWYLKVPEEALTPGAHSASVRTVDVNGNEYKKVLAFEVLDERPAPYFRSEVFE